MKSNLVVIFPKDVERITGRGEAYGRRVISIIRNKVGKDKHQFVTYREFCEFSGLTMEEVMAALGVSNQ